MEDLWTKIGSRCLELADKSLDEAVPTAATVETVKRLVDIAISIDALNLRWATQTRCGASVFPDQAFSRPKAKN